MATLNLSIQAGADDGVWGASYNDAGSLAFVGTGFGSPIHSWFRFSGVSGLSGVTIDSATLRLFLDDLGDFTAVMNVAAEDAESPTAPTSNSDADSRTPTTASTTWDWDGKWTSDGIYYDIDVTSVIQELVDSHDPSAILILCTDDTSSANATFDSFENVSGNVAQLDIEYTATPTASGAANLPVVVVPSAQGTKHGSGTAQINLVVTPQAQGEVFVGGPAEIPLVVAPQATGTKHGMGAATIPLVVVPTAQGKVPEPEPIRTFARGRQGSPRKLDRGRGLGYSQGRPRSP